MALAPGTKVGPYEIITLIGAGGMGEVYRAHDARLGRPVAVKVIRAAGAPEPDRLRRFELEARAAGILNHPNVLAIYDVGTHENAPYLVSELLEGETLRDRLKKGALPPAKAVELAVQIAAGLAAAHAKGIIHRDLKPENLFLTKDGRAKILDFGLAKLTEHETFVDYQSKAPTADSSSGAGGRFVGTVSYMSPEQIRGGTVDHRSDIFAFGAVLYEMLTGRKAFLAGSPVETMHATLNDEPAFPEAAPWPPALEMIVRHCIEKEPERRFQSAPDLAFHLMALSISAGASASGVRSQTGFAGVQPVRRVRADVVLAALVAVAAVVAVAAFVSGERAGRTPPPSYRQLTYRRGMVMSARFGPDGHTIVYGASWEGKPFQLYSSRSESPESRSFELPDADILSISSSGELAISLGRHYLMGFMTRGTLARVPEVGGAPREVLTEVEDADWSPDGKSLAVAHVVQGKYRLEFPIGNVLYQSSGWINHVRVAPDGKRVAFLDHPLYADDRGYVSVVDAAGSKRALTAEWGSTDGLAWSPSGQEIWFSAAEVGANCALHAVDLSGRARLVARSAGRLALQDIRRDGDVLLTEGRERLGMRYRSAGQAAERDLSWFDASVSADLSPDGNTVLFVEMGDGGGTAAYAVYTRKRDGSPAVRLGEGLPAGLSPDGKLVLSIQLGTKSQLAVWPTGAGESKIVSRGKVSEYRAAAWLPDGHHVVFAGIEPEHAVRIYVQDIDAPQPTPISPEGLSFPFYTRPLSTDGRRLAVIDRDERVLLLPIEGGEPQPIAGLEPGDRPIGWSAAGNALFVFRQGQIPGRVERFDLSTRRREPVAELLPVDAAAVSNIVSVQLTPDASSLVYTYKQLPSDLYLVEGLR